MNFYDSYYDTAKKVRDKAGIEAENEFLGAMIRFYYEGIEPAFTNDFAELAFAGVEWALRKARGGRLGGLANGKAGGKVIYEATSKASAKANSQATTQATTEAGGEAKPEANANKTPSKAGTKSKQVPVPVPVPDSKDNVRIPFAEIVRYLNEKTGKSFRASSDATKTLIRARFAEGYSLEDFKTAIDNQCAAWLGDPKMEKYLQPSTLFQKTKFEGYVNAKPKAKGGGRFDKYAD